MAVLTTYLVVKCEHCGKKYGTSPDKLKKKKVTFPCRQCGNTVTAIRPDEERREQNSPAVEVIPDRMDRQEKSSLFSMGLTTKFLIFAILPMVVVSLAVTYIADSRMRDLQRRTIDSSTEVVQNISEDLIAQISQTVARQTRQYLFSHPDLRKEDFNRDIYFKKVVLQKIGLTGSTSLYETAGDKGAWLIWADVDPRLVGKNMKSMTGKLGGSFQQYWNVVTKVQDGKVASGKYLWPDDKGRLRQKFAVCTPVEGTPFVISASIFMDEVTAPLQQIETEGYRVASQIRLTLLSILGGGLLLIFIILFSYGRAITSKIKRLAEWADAISLGRLDSQPLNIHSRDEIGELTEAVTRMQESIRLSIERLTRRR